MKREPNEYDSRIIRRNRWRAAMKAEKVYLPYAAYVADVLKLRKLSERQKQRVGFLLNQHEARTKEKAENQRRAIADVSREHKRYVCAVTRKPYRGLSDKAREADALERAA